METEQRIDEQTRRGRRKGKSVTRNRNEAEVGSLQEEGIDVEAQAQQGGTDAGEKSKNRKEEAELSRSAQVQKEVERLWEGFLIARNKAASEPFRPEDRTWVSHPSTAPGRTWSKEKVGKAKQKNKPTATMKENVEVVGEAADLPQNTKAAAAAAAKVQLRRRKKGSKRGLKNQNPDDPMAEEAEVFRRHWKAVWSGLYGSYEDITRIPPMVYTDKKDEPGYFPPRPMQTLQIFSVKIAATTHGLPWPLDVFGMVVARDVLDHNRNVIFHRTRDNCQTISTENPYLELTGPSRAVVVIDPVHFEVMLQVKGSVQSKDKDLSFLVAQYDGCPSGMESRVLKRVCPSKLSTVELTFGSIVSSVEATISVQVVGGSWPDGFRGEFSANTTSLDDMKIQLLAFGDSKFPVAADGMVELSRRVVSVELKGELRVSVRTVGDQDVESFSNSKVFRAQRASRCKADVELGSCKMEVTVAWSLLSDRQYYHRRSSE